LISLLIVYTSCELQYCILFQYYNIYIKALNLAKIAIEHLNQIRRRPLKNRNGHNFPRWRPRI